MEKIQLQDQYPVFMTEINKTETSYQTVAEIVAYLKDRIAENERVQYIGEFDHFAHTKRIEGEIAPDIQAATNVIFCFGFALPNPQVMAVRPRSIGIVDLGDRFSVSFMEAPMKPANDAMLAWAEGLRNKD
ncbi:MAG TPA: hypothetical protein VFC95_00555 [Guyparkeria sp.]|nr:hypothetical protein [Guyparkeria sp.]